MKSEVVRLRRYAMPVIDDIRDSQKMLKGKGFKYKFLYFWEYYRIPTLIIGCVIAIVVSVIVTMVRNKPAQFQAAFINALALPESSACAEYLELDESKGPVVFDGTYVINLDPSSYSDVTYTSSQKLMAAIAGADLDVMISTGDLIKGYLNAEIYMDLREVFSDSELDAFGDAVLWGTPTDPETGEILGENIPYAINIGSYSGITSVPCYFGDDVYMGVIANAPHTNLIKKFVKFLSEYTYVVQ